MASQTQIWQRVKGYMPERAVREIKKELNGESFPMAESTEKMAYLVVSQLNES